MRWSSRGGGRCSRALLGPGSRARCHSPRWTARRGRSLPQYTSRPPGSTSCWPSGYSPGPWTAWAPCSLSSRTRRIRSSTSSPPPRPYGGGSHAPLVGYSLTNAGWRAKDPSPPRAARKRSERAWPLGAPLLSRSPLFSPRKEYQQFFCAGCHSRRSLGTPCSTLPLLPRTRHMHVGRGRRTKIWRNEEAPALLHGRGLQRIDSYRPPFPTGERYRWLGGRSRPLSSSRSSTLSSPAPTNHGS